VIYACPPSLTSQALSFSIYLGVIHHYRVDLPIQPTNLTKPYSRAGVVSNSLARFTLLPRCTISPSSISNNLQPNVYRSQALRHRPQQKSRLTQTYMNEIDEMFPIAPMKKQTTAPSTLSNNQTEQDSQNELENLIAVMEHIQ